jgi:NAD(P)-dependent dehydrogenase (short-subunit alcohol dehydrogenase family)
MKEFEDYVVLITGGGSGIGRETAIQFVQGGAQVVIADIRQEAIDSVVNELGSAVSGKICDVTSSKDIQELTAFVKEKYDRIDVLVNNAATVKWGTVEEISEEDWDLNMNVLLKGPYLMVKYFIPLLKKSQKPSIVNISSLAASQNWPNNVGYGVAKYALEKLSKQIVRDFYWLRSNTIEPGIIETPMYDLFLDEEQKQALFDKYKSLTPVGRLGKPSDIANTILFLSSEKGSFINGAMIVVDGGFIQNWLPEFSPN